MKTLYLYLELDYDGHPPRPLPQAWFYGSLEGAQESLKFDLSHNH